MFSRVHWVPGAGGGMLLLVTLANQARAESPVDPDTVATPVSAAPAPAVTRPWSIRDASVVVSAERLFGIHAYSAALKPEAGASANFTGIMLSLLYGQSVINSEDDRVNPYAVPRIGVDGVVDGTFTIGGSAGFGATVGELDRGTGSSSLPRVTGFTLYARFGYLLLPWTNPSIWLRGGPEFFANHYDDAESQVEDSTLGLALTFDPQLVITPAPHAAILVGPLINIGLWGSHERKLGASSEEIDFRMSNLGITAALALIF